MRPMQFYVLGRTYNAYGCHGTLAPIPDVLLADADNFGPAISELSVVVNFPHSGPPRSGLESLYAEFHSQLTALPKIVFRRKRGHAAIEIASDLMDSTEWTPGVAPDWRRFNAACSEVVASLDLLKQRLKASDDFDLGAFLAHCARVQSNLPSSADELAAMALYCERRCKTHRAAMSPWDIVGVDWHDFHPQARTILDDPFYWSVSDHFSPHGNDTGADLLAAYRSWLRRNPVGDSLAFFQRLVRRWGLPPEPAANLDDHVRDEAAIALAFAELKLRAACRPEVAVLARAAIERQRQQAIDAVTWSHRDAKLNSLDMLARKLSSFD